MVAEAEADNGGNAAAPAMPAPGGDTPDERAVAGGGKGKGAPAAAAVPDAPRAVDDPDDDADDPR